MSFTYAKKEFPVSNEEKTEYRHRILHVQVILGAKFELKLTTLIFRIKFAQKKKINKRKKKT